jgi:uncharacterized protein (TIGR02271 family)
MRTKGNIAMIITAPDQLVDHTAKAIDGAKIGRISQVYLDDNTGQAEWIAVSTGMFGKKESLAPLSGAHWQGEDVVLAVPKDVVKDAPNIDVDEQLDDQETYTLYRYYAERMGIDPTQSQTDIGPGHDTSGPTTDEAMTRSEEQLHVGTEQVPTGRARLRKYVVTENVTQTIPVSHEEVRVEREPITDANRDAAYAGPDISEEEHEVTLHAERPVVAKEAVPVERVKLDTETVTEEQQIDESVRKERIEIDEDATADPRSDQR